MPIKQILSLSLIINSLFFVSAYSQSENSDLVTIIDEIKENESQASADTLELADTLNTNKITNDISTQEFDSLFVKTDTIKKPSRVQIGSLLSRLMRSSKEYGIELGKLKLVLADTPDTAMLNQRVPELKDYVDQLRNVISNWAGDVNFRYLKGIENFLKNIEEEKIDYEKVIDKRLNDLLSVGQMIDEIRSDSLINLTLRDSASLPEIYKELKRLKNNLREIDSTLINQELALTRIQAKVTDLSIEILNLNQFFKESENKIKQNFWKKETSYLWEKSNNENQPPLETVFINSEKTNIFVLERFMNRFYIPFISFSLLMLIIFLATKYTINKIHKRKEHAELILERTQLIKDNLLTSFLVIGIPFYFLLVKNPPMVLISILSVLLSLFSTWLVRSHFGNKLFRLWIIFFPLLTFASIIALNWRISFKEQPYIYLIALGTILLASILYRDIKGKQFNGSSVLKFLIFFSITFSIVSLILNVFGRFSFAKVIAISGLSGFYRGISLYIFVQVFLKVVYLWVEASKKNSDDLTSFFDFQEIQKRLESILRILAFSIWFYAVIFHLGLFDPIYDYILTFISEERVLGNTTFTFGTIILFFLILIVSQFLANNIAYFASIKDQQYATSRKKRLGSSILLIRLGVIIIGFFIAMTAARIPLDKITIVLGALSVGIGFGLQTLINNLVSGIILAFERPIQIGDDIKIGELTGKVKEVGVRASKIMAYDGSDIVVPNGDLLSGQLINWTLSDKRRRIEIHVGVAYSSDMKLVKEVIEKQLDRDRIMKNPPPKVFMENFGDNSVDFRILFWVESMDFWLETKSEVITGIFEAFAENGIEIPFPQRDLYLKSIPKEIYKKIENKNQNPPSEKE
ncbi:mechanosensitive ion channel domain-containing protein [Algoriphagus sp. SE2]|uniref:mechanosensitive ion channel domain-containing protein n=1 Tax=Algoriphagus sp. SE2 TaxID=3141536 RepID=UPI0031CD7AFA